MPRAAILTAIACLALLVSRTPVVAQIRADPLIARADSAAAARDVGRAAALYQQALKRAPDDGGTWMKLGSVQYAAGQFREAAASFHRASTYKVPFAMYNAAASLARLGDGAGAIALLDTVAQNGFTLVQLIRNDSDFVALRADPAFVAVVDHVQRNATPCAAEPKARQLDFWVGDWTVSRGSTQVGTSSVQLILGSCVVLENWSGRYGDTGKSFNVYDASRDEWQQYWVADRMQGSVFYTQGVYIDGRLQYRHAESRQPDGSTLLRRLAFFNLDPDHVRQFAEKSTDGGTTWTPEYDFLYTRKR